MSNAVVGNTI